MPRKARDRLLLVATAVAVVVGGLWTLVFMDRHKINVNWFFGVGAAALFIPVVGWGYRSKLRDPAVAAFMLGWLTAHVAIFVLTLDYLGLFYYFPLVILELWIGYTVAIWRFGPPPDSSIR